MKKTFKYLLALVAVVVMGFSFAACTNEDDVDLGPVGYWSVACSGVKGEGLAEAQQNNIVSQLNNDICRGIIEGDNLLNIAFNKNKKGTDGKIQASYAEDGKTVFNGLQNRSETQAKYWLRYAAETCYQYLNNADNQALRASLPDGTRITFNLYRVVLNAEMTEATLMSANSAVLTVGAKDITISDDMTFGDEDE